MSTASTIDSPPPDAPPSREMRRFEYEGEIYEIPTWASLEEYRRLDREMPFKIEYLDGEIWAMSGASIPHNMIAANLSAQLWNALKETDCNVLSSEQKVRPPKPSRHCYPDLTVVCGPPETADDETHGLTNPTLIVEVLSPSTSGRDVGPKYDAYITIPSLKEYVIIHQDAYIVQRFVRDGDRWDYHATVGADATVTFASVPAAVPMAEIYRGVTITLPEE